MLGGGVATYFAVGQLLLGSVFIPDLQALLRDPKTFTSGIFGAEPVAPYLLLLIPGVLGALGARAMLRIVFAGVRRGDSHASIVKALAWYLAGIFWLFLIAMFTSPLVRK